MILDSSLFKQLTDIAGEKNVLVNEPMSLHTSFRMGGPADFMVFPSNADQLSQIVKLCGYNKISFFVMGNGTNLIVKEKGIRGVVIKMRGNFEAFSIAGNEITAEAGILLSRLSDIAMENCLTGLEFASGIPGTLGGAVYMNAGAYGPEMKDVVIKVRYMDDKGDILEASGEKLSFGYRTSFLQNMKGLLLDATIKLDYGDREKIKLSMDDLNSRRRVSQPLDMPSAGSVFRRPAGYYTGKLIQDCGLKGAHIGGAEVSEKHCGFIVNTGNATANDVISLVKYIQKTVFEKFGVELVEEVKIVGED